MWTVLFYRRLRRPEAGLGGRRSWSHEGGHLWRACNTSVERLVTFDINKVLTAIPGTKRIGGLARGTFEIDLRAQLYGELGLSRVENESRPLRRPSSPPRRA